MRKLVLWVAAITIGIACQKENVKKLPVTEKLVTRIHLEPVRVQSTNPNLILSLKEREVYTVFSIEKAVAIAKNLKAQKLLMQDQTSILFFTDAVSAKCPVMVSLWYSSKDGYTIAQCETYGKFTSWMPGSQVACMVN